MRGADRQMQELGVFIHGILAGLHFIGVAYNLRRRNWFDVAAHFSAGAYDVYAVTKHVKGCKECELPKGGPFTHRP